MSIVDKYFDDISDAIMFLNKLAFEKNDFIFRGHRDELVVLVVSRLRISE